MHDLEIGALFAFGSIVVGLVVVVVGFLIVTWLDGSKEDDFDR